MKKVFGPVLLALLVQAAALAQTWEFSVSGMYTKLSKPALGTLSTTQKNDFDTRLTGKYGALARVTYNHNRYYGHELGFGVGYMDMKTHFTYTDTNNAVQSLDYSGRARYQMGFYNFLVYFMPQKERWRPFMTGGVQAIKYGAPNVAIWPGGGTTNYGANFGGGLKVRLVKHVQFRLDVRDYIGGKPYDNALGFQDTTKGSSGHLATIEGSAGLGITF